MTNSFLVVSDVHLERALLNNEELKKDLYDYLELAVLKAIQLKVKYFISCGDLFDTNKPTAYSIDFVKTLNKKLKSNNITPVAISGDHSKQIDNKDWENICDFESVNIESTFVGVDYSDNSEAVLQKLTEQLNLKKDIVEFIFLHYQEPLLFGYCEEKKTLHINWEETVINHPTLKGIIAGDIHSGAYKYLSSGQFLGYCGSLGVTKLDEINQKRYIHWNGNKLNFIEYPLIRNFHYFDLTDDSYKEFEKDKQSFKNKEIKELQHSLSTTGKRPVYILKYSKGMFNKLPEFVFLYEHAIVKTTLLKENNQVIENVNIRSEITNNNLSDIFKATLVESGTFTDENYQLGIECLDSLNSGTTKDVLNKFKANYL